MVNRGIMSSVGSDGGTLLDGYIAVTRMDVVLMNGMVY